VTGPIEQIDLRRVVVVGTSCSGKTTLSRALAGKLGLHHIELDAIFWQPNWGEKPRDELRAEVEALTAADRWILDGNYPRVRDIVWPRATAILWLNLSFPRVFWRGLRRTITRARTKEELFNGCYETFRQSFLSRESILWWIITTHGKNRRAYGKLLGSGRHGEAHAAEFKHPAEVERFLAGLSDESWYNGSGP